MTCGAPAKTAPGATPTSLQTNGLPSAGEVPRRRCGGDWVSSANTSKAPYAGLATPTPPWAIVEGAFTYVQPDHPPSHVFRQRLTLVQQVKMPRWQLMDSAS